MQQGNQVGAFYLDFAKAFDKVPHKRLLLKLKANGLSGDVLAWIEDWLQDRSQRVCLAGGCSSWKAVTSGVPQGSVLGPVLFIVYVNDMDKDLLSKLLKFADDTKVYGRANTNAERIKLQDDLNRLNEWSDTWLMPFNVDKCKVIHFSTTGKRKGCRLFP